MNLVKENPELDSKKKKKKQQILFRTIAMKKRDLCVALGSILNIVWASMNLQLGIQAGGQVSRWKITNRKHQGKEVWGDPSNKIPD